jgi:ribosomal protein S18 acetylase RimI-like enzyme
MPDAPRVPTSASGRSLLQPGETLETQRLLLRAATPDDVAAMSNWLSTSALSPDWQIEDLQALLLSATSVLVSDKAGTALGLIVLLSDRPEPGAVSVPLVAVAPQRRFSGLGGEAVLAVEREVRARWGVQRCFAPVPDGRGLAVYFWLRLGYRPLTMEQAPWPLAGLSDEPRRGMWMVRDGD